ncbi:hypothetical protein D3C86_1862380 [compost metagenome]
MKVLAQYSEAPPAPYTSSQNNRHPKTTAIPEQLVADLWIGNLALTIGQGRQADTGGQATEGNNDSTHDQPPLTAVFGVCCFSRMAASNKIDDA